MLIPFLIGFTFVVSYALWRGSAPERAGALIFVLMAVLQYSGRLVFARVFDTLDPLSLAADLFAFIGFTWLALSANRIWPIFVAAMQLLSCASHFGREISCKVEPLVYAVLTAGPTIAALAILVIGALANQSRTRRGVRLASWTKGTAFPDWVPAFLRR